MPFLLAEILNFQGSTHRIGVGSFSYLFIPLFIGTGQSFQMTIFPLLVNSVYVSYNNIVKEKGNRAYI